MNGDTANPVELEIWNRSYSIYEKDDDLKEFDEEGFRFPVE